MGIRFITKKNNGLIVETTNVNESNRVVLLRSPDTLNLTPSSKIVHNKSTRVDRHEQEIRIESRKLEQIHARVQRDLVEAHVTRYVDDQHNHAVVSTARDGHDRTARIRMKRALVNNVFVLLLLLLKPTWFAY